MWLILVSFIQCLRLRLTYNRLINSTAPQKRSTKKDSRHGDWLLLPKTWPKRDKVVEMMVSSFSVSNAFICVCCVIITTRIAKHRFYAGQPRQHDVTGYKRSLCWLFQVSIMLLKYSHAKLAAQHGLVCSVLYKMIPRPKHFNKLATRLTSLSLSHHFTFQLIYVLINWDRNHRIYIQNLHIRLENTTTIEDTGETTHH